jgi:hypothetical protein
LCRPPAPQEAPWVLAGELRASERFIPPPDCHLNLRRSGLGGLFSGNLVVEWMDVSEGGIRFVSKPGVTQDRILHGAIRFEAFDVHASVAVSVRHVHPSVAHPGLDIVGAKWVDPSPDLRQFIQVVLHRFRGAPVVTRVPKQP